MADRGRPTGFKPEFVSQAAKLCELGATDEEVAYFFGVSARTIYRWKGDHPEFCQALKAGKDVADERVERSLYQRAVGYQFEAEKIFQYEGQPVRVSYQERVPADTTAAIFWLKNRKPDQWRDVRELKGRFEYAVSDEPETPEAVNQRKDDWDQRIAGNA